MKNFKWAGAALAVMALFAILLKLQAQSVANPNEDAATVPTDPLVMNSADLAAVPTLSTADLAAFLSALAATPQIAYTNIGSQAGTFYSLQNPEWPPLPFDSSRASVWPMNGFYLLSDLGFDYAAAAASFRKTSLASSAGMMSADDLTPPGDGDTNGYGSYTNSFVATVLNTNILFLEISNTDIASGIIYASIHRATNTVYFIESATNLATPFADWQIETLVRPTDTNSQPFTLLTQGRANLFLRSLDATGVDSDADGVPDWWSWTFWKTVNLPDTNLDYSGNGNTFAQDYSNNIVPTVFSFTGLEVTNNYVNASAVPVQLDVAGQPYYLATLVDDLNFANANWQTYASSNVTVNLGLTEGWHDVWIGLRGHGDDPTNAVWQWTRLKLDFTPPALALTGPTNGTLNVPLLQLTGASSEALSRISYDLSNAAGVVTNQLALITGSSYDPQTAEFTTNEFHCYDVPLVEGSNVVTLRAADLAGNMSVLTTNFIYTPDTNPPTAGLVWPQDGMQISGSNITIQGQVSDPTAEVSVTVTDGNGNTNTFGGRTGRDGVFWIENVALNIGTNYLAVSVSDAAGATNLILTLLAGDTLLTINPVAAGDTQVSGTLGTNGYTVWVNGNQATNNGDGTWTAAITPLCVGGGQVQATAIPNDDNGGSGSGGGGNVNPFSLHSLNAQATVPPPQGVFVSQYHKNYQSPYPFDATAFWAISGDVFWNDDSLDWEDGSGGTEDSYTTLGYEIIYPNYDHNVWPANHWPQALPDGTGTHLYWDYDQYNETTTVVTNQSETGSVGLAQEHCDITGIALFSNKSVRRTADTKMKLATGGPLGSKQMNLWCLTASATAYTNLNDTVGTNVPYDQIAIGSYGNLDTNGELWLVLPDNDPADVTPGVSGNKHYSFSIGAVEYSPHIYANGTWLDLILMQVDLPTFCVGQPVEFTVDWTPSAPPIADEVARWTLPGNFVNTNSDPNCDLYYSQDSSRLSRELSRDKTVATACWYVDALKAGTAKLDMLVTLNNGTTHFLHNEGQFNVFRPATAKATPYQPDGTPTAQILGDFLSLGISGVTNDMSFQHTVNPGSYTNCQAGYVQLITSADVVNSDPQRAPLQGIALDAALGEFPADRQTSVPPNTTTTINKFYDAPAAGLPSQLFPVTEDISFSTYLMFKPGGGIWVPLQLITWELHDHADPEWTAYSYNVQSGARHDTTTTPLDVKTTDFPHWTTTW